MGVKNVNFHVAGKTQEDNDLLKSRQSGKGNAETQFFKISFRMSDKTFEKSASDVSGCKYDNIIQTF
jgi:hypothetical protein